MRKADVPGFEDLYRQHSSRLFNLAWRMCGSRADAEDLLQEIFLLVHRKLPDFRGDSAVGTWLYRLAMNRCLDHLKSLQTRTSRVSCELDDGHPELLSRPSESMTPIHKLDLERAIAKLPDAARAVFVLHDVEGFQHTEIAEIMGISEGTSRSQVHKARLRMREHLRGGRDVR